MYLFGVAISIVLLALFFGYLKSLIMHPRDIREDHRNDYDKISDAWLIRFRR